MGTTEGRCPSCGAPIVFSAGSAQVLVCEHCQTVVARKNLSLESRGKIARIVETGSPLQLGVTGRYQRVGFRIVGHLQKDHGRGPWDEWYLELDDGRGAWLSESEGAWHLMFNAGKDASLELARLGPGQKFSTRGESFVVEEVGHGKVTAAEGQFPTDVDPAEDARYVDATGKKGVFATLDFGTHTREPDIFIGHVVTLASLSIAAGDLRPKAKKVALQQARCPQCNGPLELRAPDRSQRVVCSHCGALCDASEGKLAFLQALEKPPNEPKIPLGREGTWAGTEWTCIAYLIRSCTVEGVRYPWDEYLLFNSARGFAWLVESNGHWVFMRSIASGDVERTGIMPTVRYQGRTYRRFQAVQARVDYVLGECYWAIHVGETVQAEELVAPPYSVSVESSANEESFSHGEYISPEAVKTAFGLKALDRPHGIASSQPNPTSARAKDGARWALLYSAAVLLLFFVLNLISARESVVREEISIPTGLASGAPEAMHFTPPFDLKARGNVEVTISSPVRNDWFGVSGDLVNEATGEVHSFYSEVGYYSGPDWTEGSQTDRTFISAVEPGRYVLRLTPFFTGGSKRYTVNVRSDVPRWLWVFIAWGVLWIWPFFLVVRSASFESQRWNEST